MKLDKVVSIFGIISTLLLIFSFLTHPRIIKYNFKDRSISKKHLYKDTLSIEMVSLVSIIIPITFFFLYFRQTCIEVENELQFYICFLTCHIFMFAVVENLKNLVGRLRPDFLDRCKPVGNICMGDPKVVQDGRKSFPSGHSAVVACGYVYVIFFVMSSVVKYGEGTFMANVAMKGFISITCLLMPGVVGATRYFDNRHHITDILGGLVVGSGSALFFFKYFGENLIKENIIV